MLMSRIFRAFIQCESGAATVDWVVLSGASLASAIALTNTLSAAMHDLTYDLRASLEQDMINNPFDNPTYGECTHFYLDPAADPAAAEGFVYTVNGCAVGGP